MILAAIDELNEEGGSNKTAISQHIESIHGERLPENHSQLLIDNLNKMKESGEIVFLKNNYKRFDPEAPVPAKRGRGRPKKDPNASPAPKKSKATDGTGSGRPRGRPPKNRNGDGEGEKEKSGRPRGRPPKSKPQQAQVGVQDG